MIHQTTLLGNLTTDPDQVRYAGEYPVLNVNLAVNQRVKGRDGQWTDGEPTFYRLNIWRDLALNAAETLRKGMQVIVTGRVKSSAWEKDGEKRTGLEIDVDAIGPNLRFQTAQVQKAQARPQGGGFAGGQQQGGGFGGASDPWAGQSAAGGGWDTPGDTAPPF